MTTSSESVALQLEFVPITSEDILAQIVREGSPVVEEIKALAMTVASKLQARRVLRRSDGKPVEPEQLAAANECTGMLLELRLSVLSALSPKNSHSDEARDNARKVSEAASAVVAAVALLIGDHENPDIELMRGKMRIAKLKQKSA